MTTQPGTRIGDYLVGEPLGSGGTGTVHRATHVRSGQAVAIKVAAPRPPGRPGSTTDLRREAEVLGRAAHPNVVGLVEVVEDGADTWVVQELVDGPTLEDVLAAHGSLTAEQALGVLRGALTGLAHVHGLGLVHGDLSPRNVVFDRAGTAKLADFGSARSVGETGAAATPAFTSPESVRGAEVGPAADVYSAAAVLHLLLSGRPVFPHRDAAAVLRAQVSEPAPALTGHGPHLAALLARALAKDPAARPADGAAFLAELEEAAERTYGPGWLGRSAVTAVVGGAGAALTGTAAPVTAGGGSSVVAGVAAAGATAAGGGWTAGRSLLAVGAGAVVAAGVVTFLLVGGDDGTEVRSAADDQALRTSQAAVASASASSAAASSAAASSAAAVEVLQGAVPDGDYLTTYTTVESDIRVFPAGDAVTVTWTATSVCDAASCAVTFVSSTGFVYAGTFDGGRLSVSGPNTFRCVDPTTGDEIPGTSSEVFLLVVDLEPGPSADDSPPSFAGTGLRTVTALPGPQTATCDDGSIALGQTSTVEFSLVWAGSTAPAGAPPTD